MKTDYTVIGKVRNFENISRLVEEIEFNVINNT